MNSKQGKSKRARFMRAIKNTAAVAVSLAAPAVIAAPAAAAAPAPVQTIPYTVINGETLSGIAADCRTTVPALMSANRDRIEDQDVIFNRQTIRIPKRTTRTWKVREGDTLSQIGRCVGEPWGKIARRNSVEDPHGLRIGRRLVLASSTGAKPKSGGTSKSTGPSKTSGTSKSTGPSKTSGPSKSSGPSTRTPASPQASPGGGLLAAWPALLAAALVAFAVVQLGAALRRRQAGRSATAVTKAMEASIVGTIPAWRKWAALGVLSLTMFISSVDLLIVNSALETIAVDLKTGIDQLTWVVSGFTLALGSWPLASSAIGGRIGRRPLILAGLLVFGVASLVAATADSALTLIVARYVMGAGIGFVMPNAVATMRGMFDSRELGKALAVWSVAAGLGIVTGPLVGGLLLRHFGWGSVFLVNVPFAAVALLAGLVLIPETRGPRGRRLDWLGIGLGVPAISLLIWAVIEAPERGWTSTPILAAFAGFAALGAAWVVRERRARVPMVEFGWFRDGRISGAVVALACAYAALLGGTFLVTVWMQAVQGYDPFETGVHLLPVAAALLITAPVATSLSERLGARWVIVAGLALIGLGLGLFGNAGGDGAGYPWVALSLCLCGAGLGAILAPAQVLIVKSLPKELAAIGTGLGDTARYVGGAIGLALSASLFSTRYRDAVDPVLSKAPLDRLPGRALAAAHDSVFGAAEASDRIGGHLGDLIRESVVSGGYFAGLGTAQIVGTGIALAGALVAARLIPAKQAGVPGDDQRPTPAPAESSEQVVLRYDNHPDRLVVLSPPAGSPIEAAAWTAALVRSVSELTRSGSTLDRVMVVLGRRRNGASDGDRVAVDATVLARIRDAASGVEGIGEAGEPLVELADLGGRRGLRAVIGAVPASGLGDEALERAFEACAAAIAEAAPELAEVLVCLEIDLRTV